MTIAFGPELLGQTEKTLGALLTRALDRTGLTERHWVTLRLAESTEDGDLALVIADRARFPDAPQLVGELTDRGLLAADRLTPAGRELLSQVRGRSASLIGPLWDDLPADEVASATRVLNTVLSRARSALGAAR
jgi:hypothetical protein